MTARGSFAYYLAAVTCGSFFLAATYSAHFLARGAPRSHWARDFLFTYFFAVLLTFLPLLLVAFSLRRLAGRFRLKSAWSWVLAGAVFFAVTVWVLGQSGLALQRAGAGAGWGRMALTFFLVGPMLAVQSPLWLPVPAGAATAFVLWRIHRAFEPSGETKT